MGEIIQFPGAQRALPGLQTATTTAPAPLRTTKPENRICWNCGNSRATPSRGERFCTPCQLRGEDSPLIPCRHDGCNTAMKRRHPGQQTFDCGRHQEPNDEKQLFTREGA